MSSSSPSDRPPPALPRARSSTSSAAASPRRRPSTPVRAAASPCRCRPLTRRARRPGHGSSSYETPPRGTGSRELELPCSTAQPAPVEDGEEGSEAPPAIRVRSAIRRPSSRQGPRARSAGPAAAAAELERARARTQFRQGSAARTRSEAPRGGGGSLNRCSPANRTIPPPNRLPAPPRRARLHLQHHPPPNTSASSSHPSLALPANVPGGEAPQAQPRRRSLAAAELSTCSDPRRRLSSLAPGGGAPRRSSALSREWSGGGARPLPRCPQGAASMLQARRRSRRAKVCGKRGARARKKMDSAAALKNAQRRGVDTKPDR